MTETVTAHVKFKVDGPELKKTLTLAGHTPKELAIIAQLGVEHSRDNYLYQILNGRVCVGVSVMERLRRALRKMGISPTSPFFLTESDWDSKYGSKQRTSE